jgi:hypothetical protein
VYKGDARTKIAKAQKYKENSKKLEFALNKTRLIRFKGIVYFLERLRKVYFIPLFPKRLLASVFVSIDCASPI